MTAGTTTIGTTTIERRLAGRRLTRRPAPHYSDLVKATVHGRLFRSHSSHTEDTHDHNAAHARLSPFARASGARRGRPSLWRGRREVSGFRERHRGQSAGAWTSASDDGDPGPGGDVDARLQSRSEEQK